MNSESSDWITLATTPPTEAHEFDLLVNALNAADIPVELEENLVRQCANDVAFWLRVRTRDLPLAWNLVQQLTTK